MGGSNLCAVRYASAVGRGRDAPSSRRSSDDFFARELGPGSIRTHYTLQWLMIEYSVRAQRAAKVSNHATCNMRTWYGGIR